LRISSQAVSNEPLIKGRRAVLDNVNWLIPPGVIDWKSLLNFIPKWHLLPNAEIRVALVAGERCGMVNLGAFIGHVLEQLFL